MAYVTNAGVPLWYDVCGDGPPLVLLHGRAGNAASRLRLARVCRTQHPHHQAVAPEPAERQVIR